MIQISACLVGALDEDDTYGMMEDYAEEVDPGKLNGHHHELQEGSDDDASAEQAILGRSDCPGISNCTCVACAPAIMLGTTIAARTFVDAASWVPKL